MKYYIKPDAELFVVDNTDTMLISDNFEGDTFFDNETPLVPFV